MQSDLSPNGVRLWCMRLAKKTKPSLAEGEFLFELDPEPLDEVMTAYGGVPLLLRRHDR